jgi:DNA-binding LacI/PurR family transcriptional regulator/DNA-binding transcriptional regulator YhcF (GntR family)
MEKYKVNPTDPLPRYYQVYVSLKTRILSEEFVCGDTIPSERQLGIDYGVSRITIIKALDLLVDDDLIERQQGLGSFVLDNSTSTECAEDCKIAFCVPKSTTTYEPGSYMFSILLGATKVVTSRRIQLQIIENGKGEEEVNQIRNLISQGFDGLILYSLSTQTNGFFYQELIDLSYPFVMIDRYCPEIKTDYVGYDNVDASYRLTEILIKAGHNKIAMLTGADSELTTNKERIQGFHKALKDYQIKYNPQWVSDDITQVLNLVPDDPDDTKATLSRFLESSRSGVPTAVITINANIAELFDDNLSKIQMELLHFMIDSDIKYTDYDINLSQATISHKQLNLNLTPLVAMARPSGEDLGARAVELLLDRISQRIPEPPQKIILPMHIQQFK